MVINLKSWIFNIFVIMHASLGLLLVLSLSATVVTAQRLRNDAMWKCSAVEVCNNNRQRLPAADGNYVAKFSSADDESLNFNLTNNAGNQLIMSIKAIINNRLRITIEEPARHRHHIEYSLERDPVLNKLTVSSTNESLLIASDEDGNKVVVKYKPLSIDFYYKDILQSTFEGNRLIMDNTNQSQAFTFSVKFHEIKRMMGLFEHATTVGLFHTADLSIDPYRLKNIDNGWWSMNSTQSLYGSIPVLYGFGNHSSGFFLHNAAEMWVDIDNNNNSAYFMVTSGVLDLFVLLGPTLQDSIRQYVNLTGTPHLPQLWALGYHQCRWAYNNTEDVKDIIGKFDQYEIPLDVLWLDIEYTANREWFTWNYTSFPDPIALLNWVDAQGHRKLVPISDCHLKPDPNYNVYSNCSQNNWLIKASDGSEYVGTCWPGAATWIDFLNPNARDYYSSLHLYENFPSTPALGGFWNDMNEPATFDNQYELSIPMDTVHYSNVLHRDIHNMYGLLQLMSTHKGLIDRDNGKLRPFLLSRSYFAGSQRYTAKWNGDTDSTFDYLRMLIPMTITSNLAGVVFYGGDVPGFFGKPTDEIASRWYQTGAWIPFYRAHGDLTTERREPWTFSNSTQNDIREAIKSRYFHLPYWYTLFFEHTITGDPMIRGLFYHYPDDDTALDINDEFLVGSDILVANVYFSGATSLRVYLPGTEEYWFQITGNSSNVYQGGQWYTIPVDITFIPVFYKSGSVIPRKPRVKRTSAEIKDDPYELHIILDKNGNAEGRIYLDDFESFDYIDNNNYLYGSIDYQNSTRTLSIRSIHSTSVDGDLELKIEAILLYANNGNGTYSVERYNQTSDGTPLLEIVDYRIKLITL
ncbi:neutral alpha-glucosidase C-like [Anthonomus grandis grandis]|uniref:neutral alpha-glucosidase C-like n=1 Tax=Anthonomus grandis grandis TaxID=2921223 RepID=UPI002166A800|nr:neutral alpha-glucosidase C-like [Anthonomus grandis grandis]